MPGHRRRRRRRDIIGDLPMCLWMSIRTSTKCRMRSWRWSAGSAWRKSRNRRQANLFCVGDVKQSIYRFRLAEPARFLDRHRQFREPKSHGRVIDLQANFRSRAPLLDALNCVFKRLMTADAVDIEYDKSHHLVKRNRLSAGGRRAVFFTARRSICICSPPTLPGEETNADADEESDDGDELDRSEREAMLVAGEIWKIVGRNEAPRRCRSCNEERPGGGARRRGHRAIQRHCRAASIDAV